MARSIAIFRARIAHNVLGAIYIHLVPVSVKGALYRRHRAKIMARTSCVSK